VSINWAKKRREDSPSTILFGALMAFRLELMVILMPTPLVAQGTKINNMYSIKSVKMSWQTPGKDIIRACLLTGRREPERVIR